MWEVTGTIDNESLFDDLIEDVIESDYDGMPPHEQTLGDVTARWDRVGANEAFVQAVGGTPDDRVYVRSLVATQLQGHGIREATQNWDTFRRTADWNEIMDKARRLIQQGKVRILRNGYNNIVADVQGDHGRYQPEIFRNDPNSRSITYSDCGCGWGEFQNQPRTRQWKQYQDRPCAHILAAYWQAASTPIDEDLAMQQAQDPQQQLFQGTPGGMGPNPGSGIMQQMQAPQGPQGPAPSQGDQMSLMDQPSPADVLPQWQSPQEAPDVQPQNPASVPGLRGPTPTNPITYPAGPGGTFSSVRTSDWESPEMTDEDPRLTTPLVNGQMVQLRYPDEGRLQGRFENWTDPGVEGDPRRTQLPAGLVGEVLGTDPTTGFVSVLYMGKPWDQNTIMQPFGATGEHMRSWLIHRPDVKPPGPAIRRTR